MADATASRAGVETPAMPARRGPLRAGDRVPAANGAGGSGCVAAKPKLLDQVREAIRTRHMSVRTEEAYVHWIRRYIVFHRKRHPAEMGPESRSF